MIKLKDKLPDGYSLIQTTLKSQKYLKNPIDFISMSMKKFGDTYTATLGFKNKIILTQDTNFINYILKENHKNYNKSEMATKRSVQFFGNGLLFSNDSYWLKQRRLIQPAFHREKIEGLYNILIEAIDESLNKFPTGESVDIYPSVHRLSFEILLKSIFNIKIDPKKMLELSLIFNDIQEFLIKDLNQPYQKLFYVFNGVEKANLKKAKRLRTIFAEIINERKASTEIFSDLLDMLLNSRYEDTGKTMNDDQIIDEIIILIFAGHETTANSLSWIVYLLATNTNELNKLIQSFEKESIQDCLKNNYLQATINEGMRLYPAAWLTERVTKEDDSFGKYHYPKGTIVIPFFYGLHRHEEHWNDPNSFNPDRFLKDGNLVKSKNFFPFGAGPRMCVGNNFALVEMSFFLYSFLKNFKIEATNQKPKMKPLITLRPNKVILNIKKVN